MTYTMSSRTLNPTIPYLMFVQMLASKSRSAVGMLNAEGESALHEACLSDRPQNVEQLLRWGLDPMSTQSHRFPIHCAASVASIRSADEH